MVAVVVMVVVVAVVVMVVFVMADDDEECRGEGRAGEERGQYVTVRGGGGLLLLRPCVPPRALALRYEHTNESK